LRGLAGKALSLLLFGAVIEYSQSGGKPMCQTTVYLLEGGQEKPLFQDVVSVVPEGENVKIVNLFGEEKVVPGRIKRVDLLTHRILILSVPAQ